MEPVLPVVAVEGDTVGDAEDEEDEAEEYEE